MESIKSSISELIRDRTLPTRSAIYTGGRLDLIPATPTLSRVEREMVGLTNSEHRVAHCIRELRK